jgi:hypothetical protein
MGVVAVVMVGVLLSLVLLLLLLWLVVGWWWWWWWWWWRWWWWVVIFVTRTGRYIRDPDDVVNFMKYVKDRKEPPMPEGYEMSADGLKEAPAKAPVRACVRACE